MKRRKHAIIAAAAVAVLFVFLLTGCGETGDEAQDAGIYLNGKLLTFAEEGETVLPYLSVENGIDIEVVKEGEE